MKNICFLISKISNGGGTERVSSVIANKLSKDNNVYFFNLIGEAASFFPLEKTIEIFSLNLAENSTKINFLKIILYLRNFLREKQISTLIVVDSISINFSYFSTLGLRVNHICWEHFNFNQNLGVRFRDLGRLLAARFCDHIVVLTEYDRKIWLENIRNIKSHIINIPNPVSFVLPNENELKLRNHIFLAVGRLVPEKGFDKLIMIWSNFIKFYPNYILKIVGKGPELENLKKLAYLTDCESSIFFHDETKNIVEYYNSSSYLCVSSEFEGFGLVILEAMACGLPIISFDCEYGPKLLVDSFKNGLLIKLDDYDEYFKGLCTLVNLTDEEYVKMSQESIKKAYQFSPDIILTEWNNIIE